MQMIESGIARLYSYLANVKNFPVMVRAASCISGVPEDMIPEILKEAGQLIGYEVKDDRIYLTETIHDFVNGSKYNITIYQNTRRSEPMKNNEYPLDTTTLEEAQKLHTEKGMILLCEDGHVIDMFRENRKGDVFYGEKKARACI